MSDAVRHLTRRKTTCAFGPTQVARKHQQSFATQIATPPARPCHRGASMRGPPKPITRRKTTCAFGPTQVALNHQQSFANQINTPPARPTTGVRA